MVAAAVCAMALGGCAGKKTIPDDTLSDIFRDIYIANAYADKNAPRLKYDSINIYEPIMNSYGYTSQDFMHTIGNFSKRKSARIADIVEDAIVKLEAMDASLAYQVNVLDRIDSTAFARTKKVVLTDSLIQIRSLADSTKGELVISPVHRGNYDIFFYYRQDSTDTNSTQNRFFFRDSLGGNLPATYNYVRRGKRQEYSAKLETPRYAKELVLRFGYYGADAKKPIHLDIDSLSVTHYLPKEAALHELLRTYIDYTLIIDGRPYYEYYDLPADSSTLHILPPLAPEEPDTVAVE